MGGKCAKALAVMAVVLAEMVWASAGQAEPAFSASALVELLGRFYRHGVATGKEEGDAEKLKFAKGFLQSGGLVASLDWGNLPPAVGGGRWAMR